MKKNRTTYDINGEIIADEVTELAPEATAYSGFSTRRQFVKTSGIAIASLIAWDSLVATSLAQEGSSGSGGGGHDHKYTLYRSVTEDTWRIYEKCSCGKIGRDENGSHSQPRPKDWGDAEDDENSL